MNKYLEKIASKRDEKSGLTRDQGVALGTIGAAAGANSIHSDYHAGNLTGRETLYHGTSADRADDIRKNGLKPNKGSEGVSSKINDRLVKKNKDLVFATRSKLQARTYSIQQDAINKGKVTDAASLRRFQADPANIFRVGSVKEDSIVKLNIPTWKEGHKGVSNPEVRSYFRDLKGDFMHNLKSDTEKKLHKQTMYRALQKDVHVHRGAGGIGTDYIKGSGSYKPNSLSEIGQFAKANKGRFAKAVGRSALGIGAIGLGLGYAAKKAFGSGENRYLNKVAETWGLEALPALGS